MDCKKVESKLIDFYYKELSVAESTMVQTHMDGCGSCRVLFNRMSVVLSAEIVNTEMHANEFLNTRIMAKMAKKQVSVSRVKVLQYFLRPMLVASLVVLGIFTGIKISDSYSAKLSNTILADETSQNLATKFAGESYLTIPNDEYIEMYLNDKQ